MIRKAAPPLPEPSAPDTTGEAGQLLRTERTIVWIRWGGVAFALFQVLTYYIPYPGRLRVAALGIAATLALGNLLVWGQLRRAHSSRDARRIGVQALVLDLWAVAGFLFVHAFDPGAATWAILYVLPLEAAVRFRAPGAIVMMAAVTVLYAAREAYGAAVFGHDLEWTSVTFRMGIGFIIAAFAGAITSSLVDQRRHLQQYIDHMKTFNAKMTLDGRIVMVGRAALLASGLPHHQLMGANFLHGSWWTFDPEVHTRVQSSFNRAAAGEPVDYEERIQILGEVLWINFSLVPMADESGTVTHVLAEGREITAQKHAESAVRESALELAERVGELQQRNQEFVLLRELADLLQSSLSNDEAYGIVTRFGERLFPEMSGALYIMADEGERLQATAAWGELADGYHGFGVEACWALRRGRSHEADGSGAAGPLCAHVPATSGTRNLCVPVVGQGRAVGMLHLARRESAGAGPDSQPDWLAETVASQLALAVTNLRLRETLRAQAVRDPLTALFNRRYMEETLTRELHRADREGQPVSVVMADLDHLKRLNDGFGHAAGDAVLKALAWVMHASIRGEDVACRYGGEEFVLILPGASLEVALERAESIRAGAKNLRLQHDGSLLPPVGISIGVATYPDHAATPDALIATADRAMYEAKASGRDRVVTAAGAIAAVPAGRSSR